MRLKIEQHTTNLLYVCLYQEKWKDFVFQTNISGTINLELEIHKQTTARKGRTITKKQDELNKIQYFDSKQDSSQMIIIK